VQKNGGWQWLQKKLGITAIQSGGIKPPFNLAVLNKNKKKVKCAEKWWLAVAAVPRVKFCHYCHLKWR
jgi:hypothetical protein